MSVPAPPPTPRPGSSSRRRSLVVGTAAAAVALVVALAAAAAFSAGTSDPESEVAVRLSEEDQEGRAGAEGQGAAGGVLPEIGFERMGGGQASFAAYRGRPLVVSFFASWCEPCAAGLPALQALHVELGDRVAILGIDLRDDPLDGAALVERAGVTFDVARDPTGALFEAVGGVSVPTTLLVSAAGEVLEVASGVLTGDELGRRVEPLLG